MSNGLLLWVDDEIDLLKAHLIFLENKGYDVVTVTNGIDAIDLCRQRTFDLVLLDEMMPGITGLETLQKIKEISPATPVVMVTKSEEEDIMNRAIGSKIADYLIKPVNPNQILLALKKNIHRKEIITEVTQSGYQRNFQDIAAQISACGNIVDWMEVYKLLARWELDLSSADSGMMDMLSMQKEEANIGFGKFVKNNYLYWTDPQRQAGNKTGGERPTMSPDIFKKVVFPILDKGEKVFMIVIDNFRFDQWIALAGEIGDMFDIDEGMYVSILPTATQYARNAIFSGLMPSEIAKMFPDLWVDEDDEEGKNLSEDTLIRTQIGRFRRHDTYSYAKVNDSTGMEKFMEKVSSLKHNDLNVLVVNFIDILSHARTESKTMRELANDETAYRSITLSWLRHSALFDLFKILSRDDYKLVITTDHGSIRVDKPVKIMGDRNTTTNLRYKMGKNLSYDAKDLFVIHDPRKAQLPAPNISTSYVFATGNDFFAYPNNYNHYVSYYKDTFQHGGVSMEEMLVPLITLTPRKR